MSGRENSRTFSPACSLDPGRRNTLCASVPHSSQCSLREKKLVLWLLRHIDSRDLILTVVKLLLWKIIRICHPLSNFSTCTYGQDWKSHPGGGSREIADVLVLREKKAELTITHTHKHTVGLQLCLRETTGRLFTLMLMLTNTFLIIMCYFYNQKKINSLCETRSTMGCMKYKCILVNPTSAWGF